MKDKKTNQSEQNEETTVLTLKDFSEFLSATGNEQFEILLAHAERNSTMIKSKATENPDLYEAERENKRKTQ